MKASTKWLHQRITGLILFIITPFLFYRIININLKDFFSVSFFLKDFLNAFCFFTFITISLYHGYIGIYSIITDYIKNKKLAIFLLSFTKILFLCLTAISFYYLFLIQNLI